jgi:hypothetical protein
VLSPSAAPSSITLSVLLPSSMSCSPLVLVLLLLLLQLQVLQVLDNT